MEDREIIQLFFDRDERAIAEEGDDPAARTAAFLRGLEPLERDLFVGRYWYAYTPERLAQEQGLSRGAVNTRLMRTRNKLKDYLRKEGYTV